MRFSRRSAAVGMGEVYKAKDTRLDRTVAIKVLPSELAADPEFTDRFHREARAISALDHPHICALYDVGRESPSTSSGQAPSTGSGQAVDFLVMQYLDGETLADRGWETYSASMDAQTRNAIYGYIAEADNQTKAAYMREVVMPGMARLFHRPAYDFTKPYDYNRTRLAFGCYHCHRVK
jgi:serine/threonine protein kinase